MAHAMKNLARSLDQLGRAVRLAVRLLDRVGEKSGRVDAVSARLQRALAEMDAHRYSQPLDKRLARQHGDRVFALLVELLSVAGADEKKRK
jgi:ABC-type transporter Mla subunit MlaD